MKKYNISIHLAPCELPKDNIYFCVSQYISETINAFSVQLSTTTKQKIIFVDVSRYVYSVANGDITASWLCNNTNKYTL